VTTSPTRPIVPVPMAWWDIEQIAALEQVLFPTDSPWTPAMFWAELSAGRHYVVVRDEAGRVDGYAGLAVGGDEAEVQTIGVRPDRQGGGIGRALLLELISAAAGRRMLLEVRTDNEPALALYRSHGFETIGLRRRYYQPSGADAFSMSRPASAAASADGDSGDGDSEKEASR
jgi:ribosomal-protein-alanine N-acetyltransferase